MRILGFPLGSFIYEIVIPGLIVIVMFYYCWLVKIGKIE